MTLGLNGFPPPSADTVAAYDGTSAAVDEDGDGGGNREAYCVAMESTANAARRSVVTGGAPAGAVLRLRKASRTSSSPIIDADGEEGVFDDALDSTRLGSFRGGRR